MNNYLLVISIIVGTEFLITIIFKLLSKWNGTSNKELNKINFSSVFKGFIERSFVTFALIQEFPQIFTVFAALKIATRIKDDERVSNDFYLIGNIISITLAIIYYNLINHYLA